MSRKSTETRKRILESAISLLESEATSAVRMSDIAKTAGLSRQAVYLHFPKRADLLIAAARHLDEVNNTDARLAASRSATTGLDRLDAYIEAWGNFVPQIYGVAKALLAMKDTDEEAKMAWNDRMSAFRQGCEAVVKAMENDGSLTQTWTVKQATDLLWTLMSVRNWELLRQECGWSKEEYISSVQETARRILQSERSRL